METLAKEDVIKGLKAAKRLAKQDLLASSLTDNPEYWVTQAEARRRRYGELINLIETEGVEAAFQEAAQIYAKLPTEATFDEAELKGETQAIKMFFTILGVDERKVLQSANPLMGDKMLKSAMM